MFKKLEKSASEITNIIGNSWPGFITVLGTGLATGLAGYSLGVPELQYFGFSTATFAEYCAIYYQGGKLVNYLKEKCFGSRRGGDHNERGEAAPEFVVEAARGAGNHGERGDAAPEVVVEHVPSTKVERAAADSLDQGRNEIEL